MSHNIPVDIVTKLLIGPRTICVGYSSEENICLSSTAAGFYPVSNLVGTGDSVQGVKRSQLQTDTLLHLLPKQVMRCAVPPISCTSFRLTAYRSTRMRLHQVEQTGMKLPMCLRFSITTSIFWNVHCSSVFALKCLPVTSP